MTAEEVRRQTLLELKKRLSENDETAMWNIEDMLSEMEVHHEQGSRVLST